MTSSQTENSFAEDGGIAGALRALPPKKAPDGGWERVLDRHEARRQLESRRRRYWGGGMAVAASIAVAVVGLQMGAGFFAGTDIDADARNPGPEAVVFRGEGVSSSSRASRPPSQIASETAGGAAVDFGQQLEQMDMEALVAFSQFQEERLRSLPLFDPAGPGQVLEVGSFGLTTELEDQIALLDEGLIPATLNAGDQAVPRRLLQERALLMEDLFDLRHAEAAEAGFIYADF
ncbi:MAG: hypothetical protein OXG29_07625 [Gammaproteobacteria bacterium]|nr:hypothetical protein [Gammaproteobacteria bacterium]